MSGALAAPFIGVVGNWVSVAGAKPTARGRCMYLLLVAEESIGSSSGMRHCLDRSLDASSHLCPTWDCFPAETKDVTSGALNFGLAI